MRQPIPDLETFLRRSAPHLLWIAAAAVAALVLAVSSVAVVDTTATASLLVAFTMGYFVEANALVDAAPRNPTPFGLVAGALAGALVGIAALVVVSTIFWLAGVDGGVPGGVPVWALVGGVIGAVLGVVWSLSPATRRNAWRIAERTRPVIFVAPALLFVGATLVVPTIRTVYLGFRGRRGEGDLSVENYRDIFGNDNIVSADGFSDIWGSQLFRVGMVALVLTVVVVLVRWLLLQVSGRQGGPSSPAATPVQRAARYLAADVDLSGPLPVVGSMLAITLALLAMVGALAGVVVWNNLFWMVFVTGLSTIIGLAIAVLADRSRGESLAKSLIFMPMAISFVGASVIWRFVYAFVPGDEQVGVLNAVWVGAGNEAENWLLMDHWNTLFLLAIMIWIQTGFAMVLLSAAIKAVPTEMLEAARIDGASEGQRFWWVTLPQIRSTLAVVVVTLIITVLKIYDIVKVMTNGEYGTNVLANQMFDDVFRNDAPGRGSALAVVLFVAVVPLMVANVRRLRRGEQV